MNRWVHSTLAPIWLIAVSLVSSIIALDGARAAEETFPDYNIAITPPDGWQKKPANPDRPTIVASYRNPTNTAALFVVVKDAGKFNGPIDERFIAQYERSIVESGMGRRTSGTFPEVGGLPGYERHGVFSVNGKDTPTFFRIVFADGKLYMLQALHEGGDAGEDPEIRAAFDSFRFLTLPTVKTAAARPGPSAVHKLARRFLRFKLAIVGVAMLLAVAIGVTLLLRRTGSRQPDRVRRNSE